MNRVHPNPDRLDLNLLRVFAVVWQERHLSRAADSLSLTPSAVSHALRRLRDHFGDPLFQRQGHRMQPTPTCARMAPDLLAQLSRLQALLHDWGAFDPAQSRQLFRLALPEASEAVILPGLVAHLAARAPMVTLQSVRIARTRLMKALTGRVIDLAIDVPMRCPETVRQAPLLQDVFCILSRAGHPITAGATPAGYAAAGHIAVSGRQDGAVIEDLALAGAALRRDIRLRCQGYASAAAVAAGSDLLLTVPRRVAASLTTRHAVVLTDMPLALPPISLHLYWAEQHDRDPAHLWLREGLRESLRAGAG